MNVFVTGAAGFIGGFLPTPLFYTSPSPPDRVRHPALPLLSVKKKNKYNRSLLPISTPPLHQ
ncbi:hypothetical protein, partial [Pseudomonas lactis]|uniref:hypothetical protein n=1 Tax=Pseudomonas lactis TaxID=1615674 RepID=UPI001F2F0DD8